MRYHEDKSAIELANENLAETATLRDNQYRCSLDSPDATLFCMLLGLAPVKIRCLRALENNAGECQGHLLCCALMTAIRANKYYKPCTYREGSAANSRVSHIRRLTSKDLRNIIGRGKTKLVTKPVIRPMVRKAGKDISLLILNIGLLQN